MAKATKKAAAAEPAEAKEEAPSTEFVSFIKDGPTQDDLNPAYAAPKEDGDEESDDDKSDDDK
jgi:hypothetical protein